MLDRSTRERIEQKYTERGASAQADDVRAGNRAPTSREEIDEGTLAMYLGLDYGGSEFLLLCEQYDAAGDAAGFAREAAFEGYCKAWGL